MKIFAIMGIVLIAVIISVSFIFTYGMYINIPGESNTTISSSMTPDNESYMQYQYQFDWQVILGLFAVCAAIILVFWLVLTQ